MKHVDHAPQLAQVGLPAGGGLRGPHSDEVDVGLGQLRRRCRRGEAQIALLGAGDQQLGKARLVEGGAALGEGLDLLGSGIDSQDVVSQVGHGGGVDGTEVSAADDGELKRGHESFQSLVRFRDMKGEASPRQWRTQIGSHRWAAGRKAWTKTSRSAEER